MTWKAYCWREAVECEKLAREVEGEARAAWLEAAQAWWSRCTSQGRLNESPARDLRLGGSGPQSA